MVKGTYRFKRYLLNYLRFKSEQQTKFRKSIQGKGIKELKGQDTSLNETIRLSNDEKIQGIIWMVDFTCENFTFKLKASRF